MKTFGVSGLVLVSEQLLEAVKTSLLQRQFYSRWMSWLESLWVADGAFLIVLLVLWKMYGGHFTV